MAKTSRMSNDKEKQIDRMLSRMLTETRANLMQPKNYDKPIWIGDDPSDLFDKLLGEAKELSEAIEKGDLIHAIREAADVAAYAGMLIEVCSIRTIADERSR